MPLALRMTVADARLQVGPAAPEGTAQPDLAVRSTLGGVVSLGMRTLLPKLLAGAAPSFVDQAYAPDFELADRQGKPVKLSDFRGKKVLLVTWASW